MRRWLEWFRPEVLPEAHRMFVLRQENHQLAFMPGLASDRLAGRPTLGSHRESFVCIDIQMLSSIHLNHAEQRWPEAIGASGSARVSDVPAAIVEVASGTACASRRHRDRSH